MDKLHIPGNNITPNPMYGRLHPDAQTDAHGHVCDEIRAPPSGQMADFDLSSQGQTFGQMLDTMPQYEPPYFKPQH
jgi:hypothetical protein